MADKGWTARIAAAAGVAAGTGAAQLGLGYGLGVVVWPALPTADDSVWLGSLGWATWIAASATVFGAVIAGRLGRAVGGPWRFALAASAAVGALLTVALIAIPARATVRTDTFSPQTIAGGYAVIGVLLGLAIAYWAVVSRPVAANLIATAASLWSLAVAAIVVSVFWNRPSATYLSSWQFAAPDSVDRLYGTIYWPSALLTMLAALIVGVIGALPAVRRGDLGVGAAASGAVGPLLVAAAFFVLAPQLTGALGPLESAYLVAPYAVLAGLSGSALTVGLGQRLANRRAARTTARRESIPRAAVPRAAAQVASASPTVAPAQPEAPARSAGPGRLESSSRLAGRSRPSFLGRLRRSAAAQDNAEPAVATGRAKAPASSPPSNAPIPPAPRAPSSVEQPSPPPSGRRASSRSTSGRAPSGSKSGRTTSESASGRASTGPTAAGPAAAAPASSGPASSGPASSGPAASGPAASGPATSGPAKSGPATSGSAASGPTALTSPPKAPPPTTPPPTAPAPTSPPLTAPTSPPPADAGSVTPRGKAPVVSPGKLTRPGVASADGGARPPASATPGRSDSRSTVAPPPTAPQVAKINPPRPDEATRTRAGSTSKSARSGPAATPSPADAANSDKTPPPRKTPPKSAPAQAAPAPPAKTPPAKAAASAKSTPAKSTPAKTARAKASPGEAARKAAPAAAEAPKPDGPVAADDQGSPGANPLWVDDDETAELPVQEPKKRGLRRFGRRSGDDQPS